MTEKDKLALIYRIVSGYTIIGNYIIDTPTDSLINESLVVRSDVLQKYRFEGLLSENYAEDILIKKRVLTPQSAFNLKELDKSLDNCKLQLYQHYGMPSHQVKKIRNQLDLIKKKQAEQLGLRHCLDRFSIEGLADYIAERYIFSKILLDKNYKPITVCSTLLDRIIRKYKESWPSNGNLRLVARTEPWRSFWSTNPTCFRAHGDEQKVLILFSKMYDNVYEHSEKPVEDIINDDDMLDGWFISMKRKNEEARKESTKSVITNRHPNAGEIFMMAETAQQAKEIEEMNDIRGQIIKGKINAGIKDGGLVRDKDILELRLGS